MFAWHTPDTQTLIAGGLGLAAALHVLKRWWPQWAGVLARRAAPAKAGCGSGAATATAAGSGCAAGCGQCGSPVATAAKDHRVHIVRRAKP